MSERYEKYMSYPIGILVAFAIFSIILLILGFDPILSLIAIPYGAFGRTFAASETLIRFIPLLLTSMAFLVAFKARFLNIGAEGQLYIGALVSYLVAAQLGGVPGIISIPIIMIAAFLGGVAWLALPIIMRTKLEINEIFPTVVLNFIAMFLISWLCTGPLQDPNAFNPRTPFIPESTELPILFSGLRIHVGLFVVIILALLLYVILFKTTLGYRIRAVGQNPRAAKHGGVSVTQGIVSAGLLSGGLAGLAGMMEVIGTHHFLLAGFSPGFGYVGIAVAALGSFHPIGVLIAAFFFAVLQIGGESMQRVAQVPVDMIFVMQGVLVLSVLIVQKWVSLRRSS
ncbi:MAG: ABC transporter permease [Candidatus Thorarchaeota archaeon]|jgi:simple sugar transport system permease protein